jgi:uncharacterized protein YuzE
LKIKQNKPPIFKVEWLIDAINEDVPNPEILVKQLEELTIKEWIKQPYIYIVSKENTTQKNAQNQFNASIILEHKTEGTIILDILKDGRIIGFELYKELD